MLVTSLTVHRYLIDLVISTLSIPWSRQSNPNDQISADYCPIPLNFDDTVQSMTTFNLTDHNLDQLNPIDTVTRNIAHSLLVFDLFVHSERFADLFVSSPNDSTGISKYRTVRVELTKPVA